ncbi:SET domain protein [compost metagenome]
MGQLICFVNHSCSPNAKLVFDNEHRLITLVALRDIEKDEQITISYFGDMYGAAKAASSISDEQYHKMRRDVAHHHGFTCAENCFCESHVKQFMLNRQNKG